MKIIEALKEIRAYGDMVHLSTWYFTIGLLMWSVLGAYYMKQMGILVPLTILAGYKFINNLADLSMPYIKHWSMHKAGLLLLSGEVIELSVFLLIPINADWFIYGLMFTKIYTGVFGSVFGINYDHNIAGENFKSIQIMERVTFTVWGIVGSGVAVVLYTLPVWVILSVAFGIKIVEVYTCWLCYSKYWRYVD